MKKISIRDLPRCHRLRLWSMEHAVQAGMAALVSACLISLVACSSSTVSPPPPAPAETPAADLTPSEPAAEVSPTEEEASLQTAIASTDLSVGLNRLAFGLIGVQSGPLNDAEVQVSTFYLTGESQEGPIETVEAVFREWPVGPGGIYTAHVTFDRPGTWGIGIVITGSDGSTSTSSTRLEVGATSLTPAVGAPIPRSASKTVDDVSTLEELTTDLNPDPDLYELTIAEAVEAERPLLVTFSTPAFCTTATCGPQLDVVRGLKRRYADRLNFIHIEIYDNPLEMREDFSSGRLSPAVEEWNLPSEPWTFIVDGEGLVYAKFEGFTTAEELEAELAGVLE